MAKKSKLTKSKSIYTIKNKHSVTNNGVIYENDHFTIIPNDGIYDEEDGVAIFSESNFKYKVDTNNNSKKRHVRGDFVKNEMNNSDVWTLETLSAHTSVATDSKIIIKPNYSSLKDFAYYGSAVELIKATVQDIIKRFPGGLYYNNNKLSPILKINDTTYYYVSNEFDIDCWTGGGLISSDDVKNPMRILAASYKNYVLSDGETECSCPIFTSVSTCLNSIIGTVNFGAGDFDVYMDGDGEKHLVTTNSAVTGTIITPKQEFIDNFWDTLDDFERVLLNRETSPVYKAVFETPYSNDTGFYYESKNYIWPTVNGDPDKTAPDLTSVLFQGYLASLLSLAEFHDTYDSDNIWRMMTHESIKNLDWSHSLKNGDTVDDLSDFDTTGISAMIRIYGRQFDDIKRYIDNIKQSNTISYDEKNNIPDYFLSDTVENDGWEAKCITPESSSIDVLNSKVNSEFLRRLSLSSNYIQSLKGTRRGIEAILGMFGYEYGPSYKECMKEDAIKNGYSVLENVIEPSSGSPKYIKVGDKYYRRNYIGTYTIEEQVAIVLNNEYNQDSDGNYEYASIPYDEACRLRSYYESLYEDPNVPHLMYGFPVAKIEVSDNDSNIIDEYLVPWMEKNNEDFYFQCKGGWGKVKEKNINLPSLTSGTTLSSSGISIYGETQPYMKFADTIDEMIMISNSELYDGMICYVADISNINEVYEPFKGESLDDCSHYFSLKNIALATRPGFVKNDTYHCYGWYNVKNNEISNMSSIEGRKVLYLESLRAEYKGNNPHVGFGHYDDGESYLEKYTNLFKEPFDNGQFEYIKKGNDQEKDDYNKVYDGYGFVISSITDNNKCAYFHDYSSSDIWLGEGEKNDEECNSESYSGITFPDTPIKDIKKIADESQANGIINIKNLIINFNIGDNVFLKKYIQEVVLKYLEEMIPSTAILEYHFNNEKIDKYSNKEEKFEITYIEKASQIAINTNQDINIFKYNEKIIQDETSN